MTVDRLYNTPTARHAEVQSVYPVDLHTSKTSDPFPSDKNLLAIATVTSRLHCLDFELFWTHARNQVLAEAMRPLELEPGESVQEPLANLTFVVLAVEQFLVRDCSRD
jgi:hypothetical protein